MALLPFSTLATYVPEGDHDTELMAELEDKKNRKSCDHRGGRGGQDGFLLVVSVQSAIQLPRQHVPHVEGAIS